MTTEPAPARPVSKAVHKWSMLAIATCGQAASSAVVNGPAFLIPALHAQGLSLATAGLVAAASIAGATCTLILWGAVVDRVGERVVLVSCLGLSTLALIGAVLSAQHTVLLGVMLFLAGAATGGTASASGRIVVGWFPPRRRGVAMGIRQISQPVGVGVAALLMPVIATDHGVAGALGVPLVFAAVMAVIVAVGVLDPARTPSTQAVANPYRDDDYLARIHAVSVLLVIPQFTVWTFMLVWLQVGRHWSPAAAGILVAVAQLLGAAGRIAAGAISDAVGSRMRPLRWISALAGACMIVLGVSMRQDWAIAVPLMMLASMITVADNGLAFTAVAERAGPFWSGRALGLQNTGQYLTAAAVPPLAGALIPAVGYGATFGLTGIFPLLAVAMVPSEQAEAARVAAPTHRTTESS